MRVFIKRLVSTLIIAALFVAAAPLQCDETQVYGATLQEKLEQAKKDKKAAQEAEKAARGKMEEAMAQITKLDDEAEVIRAELSAIDAVINDANEKIAQKEQEIADYERQISEKDAEFCERLRAMDETNTVGYIDLLLNSSSLSEFVSRIETVREITEFEQDIINEMIALKNGVEASKAEVIQYRDQQQEARALVQGKQNALDAKIAEKTNYMKALEKDVAKYEQMEKAAAAQEESLKKSIAASSSKGNVSSNGRIVYSGGVFCWPAPSCTYISSEYGYRIHPVYGTKKYHSGMDMAAPGGSPILAAANGTVRFAGWNGGYGYCVIIDHGSGIQTLYGHSSKLLVSAGQTVTRGQKIALVGTTGTSTGNHLHFEVLNNGVATNPRPYLS